MSLKNLILILSLTLISWNVNATCIAPVFPSKVQLSERVFAVTKAFNVVADGQALGTVKAKFFSLSDTFIFSGPSGEKIAEAKTRLLSWGVHIDVTDCEGAVLGAIKENIVRSFWTGRSVYSIVNAQDVLIAQSQESEWFGTEFSLYDSHGNRIAKISRPWFSGFTDLWTIETGSQIVDPRFLVMIGAFKTLMDERREQERDGQSQQH